MKRSWKGFVGWGLSLVAVVLLFAAIEPAQKGQEPKEGRLERVDVVSTHDFSSTVKNLDRALKAEGMMIVARIDHQNMLSMMGAKIGGSLTLEFGKPDMGKMLLPDHPEIGLLLPAKIYVFERKDGKTVVSYYKPSFFFGHYEMEMARKAGMMMDMAFEKVTREATK